MTSRVPRPRFISVHWFADALAAISIVCILALLLLWSRSRALGGDERVLSAPGAQLHFCSRDGRIMVGIFWPERPRGFRMRARPTGMQDLINDESRYAFFGIHGWGVAMPHALLAAVIGVVPAWWWVVHRARVEEDRRRSRGLCRACGYDLRRASRRCPECGTDIGVAKLAANRQCAHRSARRHCRGEHLHRGVTRMRFILRLLACCSRSPDRARPAWPACRAACRTRVSEPTEEAQHHLFASTFSNVPPM